MFFNSPIKTTTATKTTSTTTTKIMIKLFKSSFLNYILQSDSVKQRKFIMISGETLKYFLTMMHEWLNHLCG